MVRYFLWGGTLCALAALSTFLTTAAHAASPVKRSAAEDVRVVELFDGIKTGEIEVKVFPKDAKEATVAIRNKTDRALAIKVPEILAAAPVLAQQGIGNGLGNGANGWGGGNGNNANQAVGGGVGMGNGMGNGWGNGMGNPGGFFNVGPDKVGKLKLVTVCLDHGLADPNPRVAYELVPIESYAKDAAVTEVLKLMVRGQLDQPASQAACWHLQNGLSWKEMASKIGAEHLSGRTEPFFTRKQLERAQSAANLAENHVKLSQPTKSAQSVASR